MPDRLARRWAPLAVAATLAAAAGFVLRFNPTDRVTDPTGPCLWHAATDINGPGCGGTRMFYYLLHGDVVQAARHHLAALIAVPLVAYLAVRWVAATWFGRDLPALRMAHLDIRGLHRLLPALQHGVAQPSLGAVHLVRHP